MLVRKTARMRSATRGGFNLRKQEKWSQGGIDPR